MEDSIIRVLDAIWKHADLIIHTNPYDLHLLVGLYDTFNERNDERYTWSSTCFALPPFLCDVLRLQAPDKGKRYKSVPHLKPGNYYFFHGYNHEYSIIYLNKSNIYYVDYYSETERIHPFRVEKLSIERLHIFLKALSENDVSTYVNFHAGSDDFNFHFREEFKRDLRAALVYEVYEQKLTSVISINDIARVLLKENPSFLMSDVDEYDYTEEDFENKPGDALREAESIYQSYLREVRDVFT